MSAPRLIPVALVLLLTGAVLAAAAVSLAGPPYGPGNAPPSGARGPDPFLVTSTEGSELSCAVGQDCVYRMRGTGAYHGGIGATDGSGVVGTVGGGPDDAVVPNGVEPDGGAWAYRGAYHCTAAGVGRVDAHWDAPGLDPLAAEGVTVTCE